MSETKHPATPDAPAPAPPPAPAHHHRLRGLFGIALEGLVALGLALVCFLAFLWVLDTVFPSSVGLRQELDFRESKREAWGLERVPGSPRAPAATLRVFSNEVRVRNSNQIAWASANQGGTVKSPNGS